MKLKRAQVRKLRLSPQQRIVMFSGGTFLAAAALLLIYSITGSTEKASAGTGMHGSKTVAFANTVLNDFTSLISDATAGTTQINVADNKINSQGRFSGELEAGSLVLIVQMQPASPASGNSKVKPEPEQYGKYEFAVVAGIEENSKINLTAALKNSYAVEGRTQVVRVPRYTSLTVNSGAFITTDPWNGTTGGIVALELNAPSILNGAINVSGKGFKGGAQRQPGPSSQSIAACRDSSCNRIYMGAGGSTGADGGGIVYILSYGAFTGKGRIHADGLPADAPSGVIVRGGSGGTVVIHSPKTTFRNISISANGGNATSTDSSMISGKLAGGAGGRIHTTFANPALYIANGGINLSKYEHANVAGDSLARAPAGNISAGIISPYSAELTAPVRLKQFAVSVAGDKVKIAWSTLAEPDNDFFCVERSIDGKNFQQIYKLNGKGTASEYMMEDEPSASGVISYRLTQTSNTGHMEIFPHATIRFKKQVETAGIIRVIPNPFNDQITVDCYFEKAGIIEFRMTDMSGARVRTETAITHAGANSVCLENLAGLPKGIYFLSITDRDNKTSTVKVIK